MFYAKCFYLHGNKNNNTKDGGRKSLEVTDHVYGIAHGGFMGVYLSPNSSDCMH
jgi:hypothetical protein